MNQCDGCMAGIPVINGSHRMGKEGGYSDPMSCTKKLYEWEDEEEITCPDRPLYASEQDYKDE